MHTYRIQCDQVTPFCSQCRRARRQCPGYRDEQTLVFRDETKKVVTKAQPTKARKHSNVTSPVPPVESLTSASSSPGRTPAPPEPSIAEILDVPRQLSLSLEEKANCYFFHNFVSKDIAYPTGNLSYLPIIYGQEFSESVLSEIVTAIGMAGIANLQNSPDAMIAARQKQVAVLRDVNVAIQDPENAKTDRTLMAVLLLGLFEVNFLSLEIITQNIE